MSKSAIPKTAQRPNLDADEVLRRFPEARAIEDRALFAKTVNALRHTPDYFWEVPASTSGKYHHPLARGRHGLWIHTKMACTLYEEYVQTIRAQDRLTEYEADCGQAAVLLHDMWKQGFPANRPDDPADQHSVSNHDVLAATWLRQHTDLPEPVISAVEAHNGPEEWGDGKAAETELERLVHRADYGASREHITVAVLDPTEEILREHPTIPVRDG